MSENDIFRHNCAVSGMLCYTYCFIKVFHLFAKCFIDYFFRLCITRDNVTYINCLQNLVW